MIVAAAMGAVETQSCMLCSFVFFGALPHALASADVRRACCARAGWLGFGTSILSFHRTMPAS